VWYSVCGGLFPRTAKALMDVAKVKKVITELELA
jgi:hypothetical protein